MRIHKLPLHRSATDACGTSTVGALVAATGKEYLWSERPSDASIDVVVIHAMSAKGRTPDAPYRVENIVSIFCECGVSAHYLISRRGAVYQFVSEAYKAWHCGGSIMPEPDSRRNVNDFSIGIELLATPSVGFTFLQYSALARLCAFIERSACRRMSYVGHEQIAGERAVALGLRQECKTDPGPFFEWQRFFDVLDRLRV